jgi:hypothetical protein
MRSLTTDTSSLFCLIILFLLTVSTIPAVHAQSSETAGAPEQIQAQVAEVLAEQVTIYRDTYGIPHVHGETDAAAVFGFMYAQAEDNLQTIERGVLWAIGRLAEVAGEEGLDSDLRNRALETERLSRTEYESAPMEFRSIAEAWAAGLNYYRDQHPDRHASPLVRFEPWHLFSRGRIVANLAPDSSPEQPLTTELRKVATNKTKTRGSNMWMLGPSKSATGNSMLFINPHISVDDALQVREGHLLSDEGLNVYGGFWPGEPSTVQDPGTEAHARALARLLNERGVDFIKVYDMVPREAYFALADEANRLGLPFAGHVPLAVRASEASDAGQVSIEHLRNFSIQIECSSSEDDLRQRVIAEYESDPPDFRPLILELVDTHDAEKCVVLAEQFARNGTWFVPTLMTASGQKWDWREAPYARFLPPEERRLFERMEEIEARDVGNAEEQEPVSRWVREVTRTMHRAGVPMLAGSDAGSSGVFWGISLHQELELLVDAGLTEVEALRAATLSPAEFLERTDSIGTVEPDKLADLVLLDANPLKDISNTRKIRAVVANGHYFDRQALDELLQKAERTAKDPKSNEE